MAAKILDGNALAKKIRSGLKKKIENLGKKPGLAVILIGENPASSVYVNIKSIACEETGIKDIKYNFEKDVSEKEIIELIKKLNKNPDIHGILVQLPLPEHINTYNVIDAIEPKKDVDGFHFVNTGNLFINRENLVPCTPKGIIRMLEEEKIELKGKHAVVVGRSNIVGKPIAMMLVNRDATVTICHRHTKDLGYYTKQADILVVAVGKPKLITTDIIKKGAVVVDVGINRVNGKIVGDVDFENVKKKASYITPVPGGVGPMTVAMLMENTYMAFNKKWQR